MFTVRPEMRELVLMFIVAPTKSRSAGSGDEQVVAGTGRDRCDLQSPLRELRSEACGA